MKGRKGKRRKSYFPLFGLHGEENGKLLTNSNLTVMSPITKLTCLVAYCKLPK